MATFHASHRDPATGEEWPGPGFGKDRDQAIRYAQKLSGALMEIRILDGRGRQVYPPVEGVRKWVVLLKAKNKGTIVLRDSDTIVLAWVEKADAVREARKHPGAAVLDTETLEKCTV